MNEVIEIRKKFVTSVKDLEVFKKAYAVSLEVHKISLGFPKIEQYALADQMRRASKSVCANLAEGFAKQSGSPAEFRRFISIAIGSSGEMDIWINYCLDLGYVDRKTGSRWQNEYIVVSKMLQSLRNKKSSNN